MSSNDSKYVQNDPIWAQNGSKWAQTSLNERKSTQMSLNTSKWAQILIKFLPVMHISVRHEICYDF